MLFVRATVYSPVNLCFDIFLKNQSGRAYSLISNRKFPLHLEVI